MEKLIGRHRCLPATSTSARFREFNREGGRWCDQNWRDPPVAELLGRSRVVMTQDVCFGRG